MTAPTELLLYAVPHCADCQAMKRLLSQEGAVYTERLSAPIPLLCRHCSAARTSELPR